MRAFPGTCVPEAEVNGGNLHMSIDGHHVPTWRIYFRRRTGQRDVADVAAVSIVYRDGMFEFLDEAQSPAFIVSRDRVSDVALLNGPAGITERKKNVR